jgi:hypothetical protein
MYAMYALCRQHGARQDHERRTVMRRLFGPMLMFGLLAGAAGQALAQDVNNDTRDNTPIEELHQQLDRERGSE